MHGLGNAFVVFDARAAPVAIRETRAIADRHARTGWNALGLLVYFLSGQRRATAKEQGA